LLVGDPPVPAHFTAQVALRSNLNLDAAQRGDRLVPGNLSDEPLPGVFVPAVVVQIRPARNTMTRPKTANRV
jgi:hypothetical protein